MMDEIIFLIIGIVVGIIIGFVIGFFVKKSRSNQNVDLSQHTSLLTSLNTQMAEIKTKFEETEKHRKEIDTEREIREELKEKRFKELMESNNKFFKEMSENSKKSDEEKEKRIKEIIDSNKKFFEEQKQSTEKFLEHQGKSREEIEKQRDAQIRDMRGIIEKFTQTVSGTKQRGGIGENVLGEVLKNSIQADVVKKGLKTDNGEVEFAWNLGDGKFIPIDSKLPDVFELVDLYNQTEVIEERKSIIKKICEKVKKEIKNIQKYQNLSNTTDNCILVVPPAVLEMCPELVGFGRDDNVFVCSYQNVFPIAHVLQDQYIKLKEEGDIGEYKRTIRSLFQMLEKIIKKCEAIEKAVTTIENANYDIKTEISKSKRSSISIEDFSSDSPEK
jgi:DNA recombination protein RmuC